MFRSTGPIFAAIRLDDTATEVIRQAVDIARHYKVKLYVCHILPDLMAVRPLFPQLQLDNALQAAEFESESLRAMTARVGAFINPNSEECELLVEYGTEHSSIIEEAERVSAGMIVVGHGSQKHRLSGIAERIVRYAHCPVLVARPSGGGGVLAATDFSDPARPAIEAAASEAKRRGLELSIVHAFDIIRYGMATDASAPCMLPYNFSDEMEQALQEHLDACVRSASAKKGFLIRGSAETAILETAEKSDADLIVLGTHGRTGLKHLALGSIAESVVRGARCSVLVVRMKA